LDDYIENVPNYIIDGGDEIAHEFRFHKNDRIYISKNIRIER